MKNYEMSRPATAEEIANYELLEKLTADYDDNQFNDFIELVSAYATEWRAEQRKKAYNKLYRVVKKMGTTVNACTDWYFIDVY